ncbi:tyrosine-type recombinase/integrase [Chlamydia muridarum]|jgi:Site-specific recombinase XerD|uniref:Virulence plasmid integrase pGP7-D n=1 Tax=Chlamydia muridarum (strain MoPn / Nigg) TaxID=243161 RepID=GP7D_CHLMU|nr:MULTISPECIES: tyrosine-type recombinase/integrase [Bacteria]Q46435.1 RecName: Full=Virulence plasmid integrase pGP7-D [Chlamydia muridarum str. Nigg]AAF39715.1 virulence plasmid integrase pGP7-D [Chlamydia muridarum str. Nigg]KDU80015.1 phage integrase family protein [Chlamydia muridarum]KDU81961.1 phage integrase family protein [Chlamydia muridarum]KDU81969.1 phage integrase family protein [Chlamydia muridarum]KDU83915.1 phage integrase family protein [Chlamydia muridarum]
MNSKFYHRSRLFLTFGEASEIWLSTLSPLTRKNYASGIKFLVSLKVLDLTKTLDNAISFDHSESLFKIKSLTIFNGKPVSEASKQARAACYISFTKFLYRLTKGYINPAIPLKDFGNTTFFKIRDRVKTVSISKKEWTVFFEALRLVSYRDYLIGKLIVQGIRKLDEILSLCMEDLFFASNQISFRIKKRQNKEINIPITFPFSLMKELKDYVGGRNGRVFISEDGSPIATSQVVHNFKIAALRSAMTTKITPRVLRASALIHLKQMGLRDEEIMRVSCLSSKQSLCSYVCSGGNSSVANIPTIL